jgi:homoserine kinase
MGAEGRIEAAVTVRVPASSANLGPGFDALGVALALYNRMRFEPAPDLPPGTAEITVVGDGAGALPTDAENLAFRAAARLYEAAGHTPPALRVTLTNAIPVSRGLGSSSTAIVGGLVGANALLGRPLGQAELLALAVEMEGHPDNVTPALLGGFQVSAATAAGGWLQVRVPTPPGLRAVVCIPEARVSTEAARRVLPDAYSRADAVFNLGRSALLVAALATGRVEALGTAMEDRLHQPYRAGLIPGFAEILAAARAAGALGACLSGSGSTLLAFTTGAAEPVGEAMAAAARAAGSPARWLELAVDEAGAVVE